MTKPATERLVMKARKDYIDLIGKNLRNKLKIIRSSLSIPKEQYNYFHQTCLIYHYSI